MLRLRDSSSLGRWIKNPMSFAHGAKLSIGYQKIRVHLVFDVKHDLRRKARHAVWWTYDRST